MNKGSLTYEDYLKLFRNKEILSNKYKKEQIQPSSVDLTLSNECYEIEASFLSPKNNVREKLQKIMISKINLSKEYIFKKNKTYLVKLNESLNLSKNIFGKCNPKSSTGRLDIFCRTILNNSDEYEKIPLKYQGEIFIEITSRSFDIIFTEGDSLNQMRLINQKHLFLNDRELNYLHEKSPILYDVTENPSQIEVDSGLKISVDLENINNTCAYKAKKNTPTLDFNKINFHNINDYWEPIKSNKGSIIIMPGEFYILKSKQKIKIPSSMAAEMIPYDTSIGDFRVHYAGFFDPGFGEPFGSFAVLEIKTNEVAFILEDNQVIARLKYEKLNKESKVVYGENIKSNYQNQGLRLSKHFYIKNN